VNGSRERPGGGETGYDEREAGGGRREASRAEREAAQRARTVTRRAIRRLDLLEWVIFGVGAMLAVLGGALVALVMPAMDGWDFRSTWIGASFFLFVVSGAIAVLKIKREERADALRAAGQREGDDG
jgi:uncharacterized membrane protein